ncbi:MAG: dTMP kinase [Candidatus Doudnabacteria bacterium]|nr:dTMP kinase [Candidatus Doudnabacteria bacterium]
MTRGFYLVFEGPNRSGKTTQSNKLTEFMKEKYTNKEILVTREPGAGPGQSEIANDIRDIVQGQVAQSFSEPMNPYAEACLYAASRAQTLRMVIAPALERGAIVVADRSFISSLAFQGAGRELGIESVLELNRNAIYDVHMCGRPYKKAPEERGEIADSIRNKFFLSQRPERLHPVTAMYLHAACQIQKTGELPSDLPRDPSPARSFLPDCVLYLDLPAEEMLRRALARGDDKFDGMLVEFHAKVREGYLEVASGKCFSNWVTVSGLTNLPVEESILAVHKRIKEGLGPYLP